MRAVIVITDSAAMPTFERAFLEGGHPFTLLPEVVGAGRTGLKAGNRVHPGGSSLLFTVVPDEELAPTLSFVHDLRDEAGAEAATKIYVFQAEEG